MDPTRFGRLLLPAVLLGALAASPRPAVPPASAAPVIATPSPSLGAGGLETKDYRIETDETRWNFNRGDFTMPHRVHFFRPGTDAVGDHGRGNTMRGTATLIGNVVVHDSGNAPEAATDSYSGNGPATLTCDQLDIDSKQKIYTATGHVHFSQGTRTGTADHGTLNRGSGVLQLTGNVKLTDAEQSMTAQDLLYNLNTKDVDVHGAPIVIKQPVATSSAAPATPKPKKRKLPF
jgi:lipopolysaccharide export system protein LptA